MEERGEGLIKEKKKARGWKEKTRCRSQHSSGGGELTSRVANFRKKRGVMSGNGGDHIISEIKKGRKLGNVMK